MEDSLKILHRAFGSPQTFADILLNTYFDCPYDTNDLVSLLTLDTLDRSVGNNLRFQGFIPLNFLTQLHREKDLKTVEVKDWITLCKKLDQSTLPEVEKLFLQCAIGLANHKDYFNSCRLFSVYLLETM